MMPRSFLNCGTVLVTITRTIRCKPWSPKFKLIRQMQPWVRPFDPDKIFLGGKYGGEGVTTPEIREHLRRNGLIPPLVFQDRPINLTHTGRILDEYVPPEGDGKTSLLSTGAFAASKDIISHKAKSMRAGARIRKHQLTYNASAFAAEADAMYKEVNNLLPRFYENENRLLELMTEKAFADMTTGLHLRTLHWEFKGSLEPPRVISERTTEGIGKGSLFAQVTVRFHTQQVLAIYDRFGRLLYGHPTCPVDILEYVVFEKYITDEYGRWRIHGKIVPPWAQTVTSSVHKTVRLPPKVTEDTSSPIQESAMDKPALPSH